MSVLTFLTCFVRVLNIYSRMMLSLLIPKTKLSLLYKKQLPTLNVLQTFVFRLKSSFSNLNFLITFFFQRRRKPIPRGARRCEETKSLRKQTYWTQTFHKTFPNQRQNKQITCSFIFHVTFFQCHKQIYFLLVFSHLNFALKYPVINRQTSSGIELSFGKCQYHLVFVKYKILLWKFEIHFSTFQSFGFGCLILFFIRSYFQVIGQLCHLNIFHV